MIKDNPINNYLIRSLHHSELELTLRIPIMMQFLTPQFPSGQKLSVIHYKLNVIHNYAYI